MTKSPTPTRKKTRTVKPTVRGFSCPDCRGVRLFVRETTRPMAGLIRRYRECTACGYRVTTEERKAK